MPGLCKYHVLPASAYILEWSPGKKSSRGHMMQKRMKVFSDDAYVLCKLCACASSMCMCTSSIVMVMDTTLYP